MNMQDKEWNDVLPSEECLRGKNPIRAYVENVLSKAKPNLQKKKITFTLGDPAVYPEFQVEHSVADLLSEDVEKSVKLQEPQGPQVSRRYIADIYSTDGWRLREDDVFLTMGGSSSLWMLLNVLTNPGDNILVPNPSFPLIFAMAENRGVNLVKYDFQSGEEGNIDLGDLEAKLKTSNAKFLLLNNPSNPLGTVWAEEHLREILALANKYRVPIVADEMYELLVFKSCQPMCIGKLSPSQPIFVFSGLSKACFVPGWRCAWIVCYGKQEIISEVKKGLMRLCEMYRHPNAVAALKIPEVYEMAKNFGKERMLLVEKKAKLIREKLRGVKGISLYNTKGALYLSIFLDFAKFQNIENSQEFSLKLLEEENINVLPGSLFYKDNMIRLVILCSDEDIDDFTCRFREFCERHFKTGDE